MALVVWLPLCAGWLPHVFSGSSTGGAGGFLEGRWYVRSTSDPAFNSRHTSLEIEYHHEDDAYAVFLQTKHATPVASFQIRRQARLGFCETSTNDNPGCVKGRLDFEEERTYLESVAGVGLPSLKEVGEVREPCTVGTVRLVVEDRDTVTLTTSTRRFYVLSRQRLNQQKNDTDPNLYAVVATSGVTWLVTSALDMIFHHVK